MGEEVPQTTDHTTQSPMVSGAMLQQAILTDDTDDHAETDEEDSPDIQTRIANIEARVEVGDQIRDTTDDVAGVVVAAIPSLGGEGRWVDRYEFEVDETMMYHVDWPDVDDPSPVEAVELAKTGGHFEVV